MTMCCVSVFSEMKPSVLEGRPLRHRSIKGEIMKQYSKRQEHWKDRDC